MVQGTPDRHSRGMSEHTITTPQIKRLERSRDSRMIAGVAGGLARYFDIAPAVFRLGFVVLTLLGGSGVLVYIAAVLVIPKEGEESSIAEDVLRKRREHPARLVALGLIAVAVLSLLARADTWPTAGAAWFLVLVAGVVLLWTGRRRGIVVAITAVLALLATAAVAAVVAAFAWFNVSLGDGVGDHTYTPATIASVDKSYKLGIGTLKIDLSQLPASQPLHVDARLGIGDLKIVVPKNATVSVDAHVKAGEIDSLGRHDDGRNARLTTAGSAPLTIDAKIGAGHLEVVRAS
jgi:phage shock protein PspC (stress-responsive transcriptional regulator)/predicted membrane protein